MMIARNHLPIRHLANNKVLLEFAQFLGLTFAQGLFILLIYVNRNAFKELYLKVFWGFGAQSKRRLITALNPHMEGGGVTR
jgi:hypothetical protein